MLNKIVLLTNICVEPFWEICAGDDSLSIFPGIKTDYIAYDQFLHCENNFMNAETIIVLLNFDTFYPNLVVQSISGEKVYDDIYEDCVQKCRELYSFIKTHTHSRVIWFGFEDYFCVQTKILGTIPVFNGLVDRINLALKDMLNADSFVDFKRVVATIGIAHAFDNKGKYRWNAPYSKELIRLTAEEAYKQYLIFTGATKKCIVLDCDNVLWGGVLSEEGIAGIQISTSGLGRSFQDFQRFLLDMYYHGVILAVCSKNDEADILRVFREHTGMLLQEQHISCFRCNWNNKPENIRTIAKNLNIGLDSIVFVDDSKFEIESVKMILPEIRTVLYHRDSIYQELSCFNLKSNIDLQTINARTNTYRTSIMRSELIKHTSTYAEYISSLNMKIDIHKTMDQELSRISELTQRTNKCTNGIRYTFEQLKAIVNDRKHVLYTVCLSDKFSNLGIVGAMGIVGDRVELFSLSCRALGRNIEDKMISKLLQNKAVSVQFIPTSSNDDLHSLFTSYGLRIND